MHIFLLSQSKIQGSSCLSDDSDPSIPVLPSEISQIFRHQIYTRDLLFERVNHFISRRLNPLAFHSCRTTCRNFPEGVKRPEVIDPDNVKQLAAVSDPVHPD